MLAVQLVIGAAVLWAIAAATGQPLVLRGPLWRIALLGTFTPALVFIFMALGTLRTSATNATIIFGLVPVALPVLGFLILRERLRVAVMLGALLAVSGIGLIVARRADAGSGDLFGDLLCAVAVMCTCGAHLSGRRANQHFNNAIMVTTYQVTTSAAIACAAMLVFHPPAPLLPDASPSTWLKLGYLGAASVVVNFLTYNYALRRLPVGRTGLYSAVAPALGTLLAVVFLGERAGGLEVVGIIAVMGGLALPALVPQGRLCGLLARATGRPPLVPAAVQVPAGMPPPGLPSARPPSLQAPPPPGPPPA
jgi:probable blue pigment (indigoidine) exporter